MAELIIQLQSWKFIEFLTTVDTCSAINHRSLLLQREQTLQKRSSVATDLRTMRPQLEILLKAVPPFNSNMIILQKVVSCVCGRRGGTPPERWRSPRIGRQLLETGRYYGGALHLQLRLLHHYCCSSVFCRCYATTLAQLFTSTTTAAVL